MSAASLSSTSWSTVHSQFEATLPQIENTIRFQFRHWPRQRREEAIADACAASWHAWHGLLARGQDPIAVGPTGIAFNACRYVKAGRRFGTAARGGAAADVYQHLRKSKGLTPLSLDRALGEDDDTTQSSWLTWLEADRRYGPGDEAAFRLDFATWLAELPPRKRRVAELLAEGNGTGEVARHLGVTSGAVSQTRAWLEKSWQRFQGMQDVTP